MEILIRPCNKEGMLSITSSREESGMIQLRAAKKESKK
jgi:hypothetical protein